MGRSWVCIGKTLTWVQRYLKHRIIQTEIPLSHTVADVWSRHNVFHIQTEIPIDVQSVGQFMHMVRYKP